MKRFFWLATVAVLTVAFFIGPSPWANAQSDGDVPLVIVGKTQLVVTELPFSIKAPNDDPKKTLYFWSAPGDATAIDQGATLQVTQYSGTHTFYVKQVKWTPDGFGVATGNITVRFQGDNPTPPPPPPVGSLWMVIIEETSQASKNRAAWLNDKELVAYFKESNHHFRVVDKDVVGPDGTPPSPLVGYLNGAKGKTLPYVFLVNQSGDVLYRGAVPETPAEMLALIRKAGG